MSNLNMGDTSERQIIPKWIKQIKNPHVSLHNKIPIYAPYLIGNENRYINQALTSQWLSSKGNFIEALEEAFARYCGVPYAVACGSGTAALFLALASLGIQKNDEVIVPTLTMISSAFAVSYLGAVPVFVDCNNSNGNIDVDAIERCITKKTKVIMPVHVYGNPCDMDEIHKIANKHHLTVLEDGAEAIGSTYRGEKIGCVSDLTAFSMYSNKIVTAGEGGMITLRSKKLYKKIKKLNNYSFSNVRHFWHQHIGYNLRLSNIQAAIGLAQVEHVEATLQKKQSIASWYKSLLLPIDAVFSKLKPAVNTQTNNWMIAYRVHDSKFSITKLSVYLASRGIETRSFFLPLHLQPVYWKSEYEGRFPHAENLAKTGTLLPSGPGLTKSEVERVCVAIIKFFKL